MTPAREDRRPGDEPGIDDPGEWIHPSVVSPEECDRIARPLSALGARRSRAGARHLLDVPEVAAIASDVRLLAIAQGHLGGTAVPFRATLFAKTARANWLVAWHQDTALPLTAPNESPEWGPWSVKAGVLCAHAPAWALQRVVALRLHLDDSTELNGPLRVVPGSHRLGVVTDAEARRLGTAPGAAVSCVAPKGSVVAMRPLVIHASSKSVHGAPRRVLHVEYAASRILRRGVELALA